jgi:hypothetical protein
VRAENSGFACKSAFCKRRPEFWHPARPRTELSAPTGWLRRPTATHLGSSSQDAFRVTALRPPRRGDQAPALGLGHGRSLVLGVRVLQPTDRATSSLRAHCGACLGRASPACGLRGDIHCGPVRYGARAPWERALVGPRRCWVLRPKPRRFFASRRRPQSPGARAGLNGFLVVHRLRRARNFHSRGRAFGFILPRGVGLLRARGL